MKKHKMFIDKSVPGITTVTIIEARKATIINAGVEDVGKAVLSIMNLGAAIKVNPNWRKKNPDVPPVSWEEVLVNEKGQEVVIDES